MGLATVTQAHKMLQDQVTERWKTISDDAGRVFRKNLDTNKMELVTGELRPGEQFVTGVDEYGRRIKTNLFTGEETQVSAAPPQPQLTMAERLKLKKTPTDIPRGDWWRDPESGVSKWIDYGEDAPAGWNRVPSREREVSDLSERRFAEQVQKDVATRAQKVELHGKKPAVKPDIAFVNQNSIGTTGYVWVEKDWGWTGWLPDPGISEAVSVELPKIGGVQLTMEDVRVEAKSRAISIEEVLREIHDAMKEK